MRRIVLVSGKICAGKTGLASRLRDGFGFELVKTSEILKAHARARGHPADRLSLQRLGDILDAETDHGWVLDAVLHKSTPLLKTRSVVVDHIRSREQLERFRQCRDIRTIHAHLYAPTTDLENRFRDKFDGSASERGTDYSSADSLKSQDDIVFFKNDADVRVNTARTDSRDTLVRVAARLGLYSPPTYRCVDVIVGGQYGSEGKGHIAAYLARDYDVLVRVGGPNAGHTVSSASGIYTYHHLPSGARDTNTMLLLGPGMTINVDRLLEEVAECKIRPERLFIDPQAMIIEEEDIEREKELVAKISSTGRGGGSAAARRIMGRRPGAIRLARDVPELSAFVGDPPDYRGSTSALLESAYQRQLSILLEGTQGSALSLYHGSYPYVTSRDTNVAGCLAEAGISPNRVRRILMVVRPTPIRVGDPENSEGTSGQLKHEVTFEQVATSAGLDPDEVTKLEVGSTTKRNRRVGWFEWEQFRKACALNAPSDIVLTFADYLSKRNQNARRFEQLTEDTIKFIEELERIAQAPVSLINTRFPREPNDKIDLRTVIDRRNWSTQKKIR